MIGKQNIWDIHDGILHSLLLVFMATVVLLVVIAKRPKLWNLSDNMTIPVNGSASQ